MASASAHVDPGNLIVQAFTSGGNSSFEAAVADAFLSAQYLLTLTGGNNLFSDPVRGLFGEFVPCLIVNGPTTAFVTNLASLDGVSQSGTGMTCGKQSPIQIFLNAPTMMQLVLQAQSDGGTGFAASAALTGFTFFGSGNPCGSGCFGLAPLEGATFTFTLNDSLPPNLPEPGTFFLIAPPAALLLARRVRRPVP
jgi:hypothetical protein